MISNFTGAQISEIDHIRQSISDILTTPKGSRVMRRNYGSDVPKLLSYPSNAATKLQIISESAKAIEEWEPRIDVSKIGVEFTQGGGVEIEVQYSTKSGVPAKTIVGVN